MVAKCRCCESDKLTEVLDLGIIPIAHKMTKDEEQKSPSHPMVLHICEKCALIQVINPADPKLLYTDYNFCFSNWKPQPHMQEELNIISKYMKKAELMVEIGSNDGTFLKLAGENGYDSLAGVEPNPKLNEIAIKTRANIYQGFYNSNTNDSIKNDIGKAKVVISRQVVEHITDLSSLMLNIRELLEDDGFVMFEVPNFRIQLEWGDCSCLWEEHVNYFTDSTLINLFNRWGFKVCETKEFNFSGGAIFAIAQKTELPQIKKLTSDISNILILAKKYKGQVENFRKNITKVLIEAKKNGKKNVLFGAGCRSNMLVHGLKLVEFFDMVVDDQVDKQGYYFPGTKLKIESSDKLKGIAGNCFLSVNYENEKKVLEKVNSFTDNSRLMLYSLNSPSPRFKELS